MPLDHEAVIQHSSFVESQIANLISKRDACNDGGARRPEATAKWNGVYDMNVRAFGKGPLTVALEHVQGSTGDKVGFSIKADFTGALAFVGYTTVCADR